MMAFGGGRRAILLLRPEKKHTALIKEAVNNMKAENALLIIATGKLEAGHALRNFFEKEKNLVSVASYAAGYSETLSRVRNALEKNAITIDQDALDALWGSLDEEVGLSTPDLEKIILFAHTKKHIEFDDIDLLFPSIHNHHAALLLYDAFQGDHEALEKGCSMIKNGEIEPIMVLRRALEHVRQLEFLVHEGEAHGRSADQAMEKLKPRPFFKLRPRLHKQLSIWDKKGLGQILVRLIDTEKQIRYGAGPAGLLCTRLLFAIAVAASKRAQKRAFSFHR